MGLACSCLKPNNQEINILRETHDIDPCVARTRDVQRLERNGLSSSKKEQGDDNETEVNDKDEYGFPKSICSETEGIEKYKSVSPHDIHHNSVDLHAKEEKESNAGRTFSGSQGCSNEIRKSLSELLEHDSSISSPANGRLPSHSSNSPQLSFLPLPSLSPSSRGSVEMIREFAERISKRILSMNQESEEEVEIAWFCERVSEKDEVNEGVGSKSGRELSGRKEGVERKIEGKARLEHDNCKKVRIVEKFESSPSMLLVESIGVEQIGKVVEDDSRRKENDRCVMKIEGCEINEGVNERIEYYEKLKESGRDDHKAFADNGGVKKTVRKISMRIALKARRFGGIGDEILGDASVVIV